MVASGTHRHTLLRYDARKVLGSFGAWRVYRIFSDGDEDIDLYVGTTTERDAKRLVKGWNRELRKRLEPSARPLVRRRRS